MAALTTADGTQIHYEIRGRGLPPMLFVHGWCSNSRHWEPQLAHFEGHHLVLAPDRRGHGESDAPEHGYTAAQHARDLAEVATAEGLTGAVAVAHAGGGPAVLELACSHPEIVGSVVMIDTRIGTGGGRGLQVMIDTISGPEGDAAFAELYASFFSESAAELGTAAVADAARTPHHVAVADLAALDVDSVALARQVTQPVLWITAEHADEAALREVFKDIRFGRVVESGHFPQLEVPDQVNAMVGRFVSIAGSVPGTG